MPESGGAPPWWRRATGNAEQVRRAVEEHRAAEAARRAEAARAERERIRADIERVQAELLRGRPEPPWGLPAEMIQEQVTYQNIGRATSTSWSSQQPANPTGRLNQSFEEIYRAAMRDREEAALRQQADRDRYRAMTANPLRSTEQLAREVEAQRMAQQRFFNQQLFQDGQQYARAVAPATEEDNVPETLKKRSREMKLMYPFAIEHAGHSYRMSYHSTKRRWRLQEWDSKRCEKIHEEFIRGQALAHATRQRWMEARSAELVPTT